MIIDIIHSLSNTSSRLEKEAILSQNIDNELLKRVLRLTYDPRISYWMSKAPDKISNPFSEPVSLEEGLDILEHTIAPRKVTGNAAKKLVGQALGCMDTASSTVMTLVIKRDLRCGVSESTINKIWPGLVYTHPVMLCEADSPKARKKIVFPASAQIKSDGLRVNFLVVGGEISAYSRAGNPVDCVNELIRTEILTMAASVGSDFVLDGELLVLGADGVLDRAIGNGYGNKAIKGTINKDERDLFVVNVWDIIPHDVFTGKSVSDKYVNRFTFLQSAVGADWKAIKIIPARLVQSWDEIGEFCSEVMKEGEEGLIIKNLASIWEDKRSKDQVKLKAELTADLRVYGYTPGNGKNESTFGSLLCKTEDSGVKCGVSGFSDKLRKQIAEEGFWEGNIIEVCYNEIVIDANGERSLFLPRFKTLRLDKTVADIL